jgi:hypothetical protein
MSPQTLLAFSISLGAALAGQTTPPGFEPVSDVLLSVSYDGVVDISPGMSMAASQVPSAPSLSFEVMKSTSDSHLTLFMDLDVVYQGVPQVLLHWLAQDLAAPTLANTSANLGSYIPPGPPPGETHRYLFLAFAQPADFALSGNIDYDENIPANRLGFDLHKFIADHELSSPAAANYFLITGQVTSSSSAAAATATPSGTVSASASTIVSPTGAVTSYPAFVNGAGVSNVGIWVVGLVSAGCVAAALS